MSDNVIFSLYKIQTGELVGIVSCQQETVDLNTPTDCGRIAGSWDGTQYWVENGKPAKKVEMLPIISGLTISNLPIPCTAFIEAARYEITDGVLELSPSLPGPYEVRLEAVPYLSKTVTVA